MEQPPNLKELFHVAGNAPDPRGGSRRGMEITHDLTGGALGHPQILTPYRVLDTQTGEWGPLMIEADVYDDHIHLHCPLCIVEGRGEHGLRIRKGAKAYEYEPMVEPELFPGWHAEQVKITFPNGIGGRLSIDPFRCTWEEVADLSRGFGLQKCGFSASIRNNVVRPE